MTDLISNSKVSIPRFPRIFAFIIDCIVLGVTGMVVGKSLYPYLENSPFIFQCIGTLICLFYFAALNSSIGQGKTIGKMVCKIRVTNLMGFSISTFHSLIRSSILINSTVLYWILTTTIEQSTEYNSACSPLSKHRIRLFLSSYFQ